MNRKWIGLGAVALVAGLVALSQHTGRADDAVKLVVSPETAADLVKDDVKNVNDALKADKVLAKDVKRARVATMLIALHAKGTGNTALYAQALKVLNALAKEGGEADAKKEAALLANPPAGGTAEGDPVKLAVWDADNKDFDRDMAMQLFKLPRAGGLGYEKMIKDFSEKNPTPKDMAAIATMAFKTASFTHVLDQIPLDKGAGKTAADWKKLAKDLQNSAKEAGEAATKKDAAKVKAALGKMDTSCVNCHEKFK